MRYLSALGSFVPVALAFAILAFAAYIGGTDFAPATRPCGAGLTYSASGQPMLCTAGGTLIPDPH